MSPTLTPEQEKLVQAILAATAPRVATAAVRNQLIAVRDATLKTLKVINDTLAVIDGGAPVVTSGTVTVQADQWPKPDPIVPEPQPEPEKASKWGKFKSVFKKVWPVATVGLAFVPGGSIITGVVNAVAGAGTLDMATVTAAAGAAGIITAATASVSEYRKQAAAEKPKE